MAQPLWSMCESRADLQRDPLARPFPLPRRWSGIIRNDYAPLASPTQARYLFVPGDPSIRQTPRAIWRPGLQNSQPPGEHVE